MTEPPHAAPRPPQTVPDTTEPPLVAVALATVHRPDDVARAVDSVLAADYSRFEIHVVDQSAELATGRALARFAGDPRVRLHRQARRGLAAALNRACAETAAELVAITGDDCVVRSDWLAELARAFASDSRVAVVFGNVVPGPYDGHDGFVPGCVQREEMVARDYGDLARLNGTTACMGVRRSAWSELGGFDEALGVGAPLRSGEDLDLALRALLAGDHVLQTARIEVEHLTPTLWRQRAATVRRNWFGSGAALAKGFKLAPARTLAVFAGLVRRWLRGGSQVAATYGPKPARLAMLAGFTGGLAVGLAWPLDRHRRQFRRRRRRLSREPVER